MHISTSGEYKSDIVFIHTNKFLTHTNKIQCIVNSHISCFDWSSPVICVIHVRQVTFQVEGARAYVAHHQIACFPLTHPALIVVSLILLREKRNLGECSLPTRVRRKGAQKCLPGHHHLVCTDCRDTPESGSSECYP